MLRSESSLGSTTTKRLSECEERSRHARSHRDRILFDRLATGDCEARDELVERFMPLANKIAQRYRSGSEPIEDVTQVAYIGLVKAIDGFDPARGFAFSSYAVPTIVGELKRYFRDRSWIVRPPRDLLERSLRVDRAAQALVEQLRRPPTVAEIASGLDLDAEQVLEAMQAGHAHRALSFDAPLHDDEDAARLGDVTGHHDDGFAIAEDRVFLGQLARYIPLRDREIVRMRFEEDMTQAEIGAVLGVSQMQVSRLLRAAIERLRAVVEHDQLAHAA